MCVVAKFVRPVVTLCGKQDGKKKQFPTTKKKKKNPGSNICRVSTNCSGVIDKETEIVITAGLSFESAPNFPSREKSQMGPPRTPNNNNDK